MYNLFKNEDIIFTGTYSECFNKALDTGEIMNNSGYLLFTYDNIKNKTPATYKIKKQ